MEQQHEDDVEMSRHHEQHHQQHHDEPSDAPPLGDQLMQHDPAASTQYQQHAEMSYDTSYHAAATAAAAAAAAAAVANEAVQEHHHQQEQQQLGMTPPPPSSSTPVKPKRAKATGKITRNRPITSCLECRARKQKCDRSRPRCQACPEDSACTYVDGDASARTAAQEAATAILAAAALGTRDELTEQVRKRERVQEEQRRQKLKRNAAETDTAPTSTAARRALIAKTAALGKSKTLDFDNRVRAARSACIGAILFEAADLESDASLLALPKPDELSELLDAYRDAIEPVFNAVIVDLNRLRISSFIKWWHSQPTTLPADPPLVPLVLVILALALQVKRTSGKAEALGPQERSATCDSEKRLLETAGRCIDALQIVCPSNWSSAFSAPLDLVRASMLRGLWHLGELHLQFASSCFASTIRLAHAAGLQRDATLWQSMGLEEAQARRNMWWSCASLEVVHSARLHRPVSIARDSFDAQLPSDYGALLGLYVRAEELQAQRQQAGLQNDDLPNLLPRTSRASFDFHYAKYSAANIFIQDQSTGLGKPSSDFTSTQLLDSLERWRDDLPETQKHVLRLDTGHLLGAEAIPPEEEQAEQDLIAAAAHFGDEANDVGDPTQAKRTKSEWLLKYERNVRYVQRVMLRLMNLHASMRVHRPQFDEAGAWKPPGEAQTSLAECLDSAQRLVYLIWSFITGEPSPPFLLYNQLTHHLFQAAVIVSIQSALCSPRTEDGATFCSRARPVLDRAVAAFDLLAEKPELRHVAEQAARYASTLRVMDAAQSKRNAARVDGSAADDVESVAAAAIAAATEAASAATTAKRSSAYLAPSSQEYAENGSSESVALAPPPPAQLPLHDPTANVASSSTNGYQVGPAEAPASDLNSAYGVEGALISEDWWRAIDGSDAERSLMSGYAGASGAQGLSGTAGSSSSSGGGPFYYPGYEAVQSGARGQHLPPTGLDLLASQVEQAPRAAQQGNNWQAPWPQPASLIDGLPASAPSLTSLGGVQHWQAAWQAWENYSERLTRDEL